MYDRNTGTFPRGEEGVKIACEKKFGQQAGQFANYVVEKLSIKDEGKYGAAIGSAVGGVAGAAVGAAGGPVGTAVGKAIGSVAGKDIGGSLTGSDDEEEVDPKNENELLRIRSLAGV
jgi:phage tail tape-measure protein